MKKEIILASASYRRSQILSSCGIKHKVVVSGVRERNYSRKGISFVVRKNAELKAKKIAGRLKKGIVIGADTLVVCRKKVIGKPKNAKEAKKLLKFFSKSWVEVYTGLFIIDVSAGKSAAGHEKSKLKVKEIRKKDIDRYFKILGPFDKAGGFSIEGVGSLIFDDVRGSFYNILGLPMGKLSDLFARIGIDVVEMIS